MANKRKHRGVIRPTVPNPQTFIGSIDGIADHLGITIRTASTLVNRPGYSTRIGWRRMTEEEEIEYYTPPIPTPERKSGVSYHPKRFWKITFFKDWKKGDPYVTDKSRMFTGTPQEFAKFMNCSISQVYRVLDTHMGIIHKYKLRTVKGWCPVRIRKYDKPYKRRSLKVIRGE